MPPAHRDPEQEQKEKEKVLDVDRAHKQTTITNRFPPQHWPDENREMAGTCSSLRSCIDRCTVSRP